MTELEHLFESSHAALTFAFNATQYTQTKSVMAQLAAKHSGPTKGLGGLDGAGQAGLIRYHVRQLGHVGEAIITARFAPSMQSCSCRQPCCSGRRLSREWSDAIDMLANEIQHGPLKGTHSNGAMRRDYVVRLFLPKLVRISTAELAERHHVERHTIGEHARLVGQWFRGRNVGGEHIVGMETLALQAIDDRLREGGLIP